MSKTTLVPYLNFDGDTKEAMEFYHSILGGNLTQQTMGEAFPETSDDQKDRIMHAQLESDLVNIMASDTSPEFSPPLVVGNNVNLSLIGTDERQLRTYFDELAKGGKVLMKLEKQFWGDIFGQLEDRFGVLWMVNISTATENSED